MKLEIGQSFEVGQWIDSPVSDGMYIGDQYFRVGESYYTIHYKYKNGLLNFCNHGNFKTKPIARLTITKIK